MARIEVQPEGLSAAGGEQAALAGRLLELASRLEAAGGAGAGAAGDPAAAQAIELGGASWAASLAMLADSVGGLAANLGSAASAYTSTDQAAMPARR